MTRFNDDDGDEMFPGQWWLWEQALTRSVNGKKGQAALRDLRDALLALPEKKLIEGRLADDQGCVCTVGALALKRRVDAGEKREDVLASLVALVPWYEDEYGSGPDDEWGAQEVTLEVGKEIGLSLTMAVALAGGNDDRRETPEERYERILRYVERLILPELVA